MQDCCRICGCYRHPCWCEKRARRGWSEVNKRKKARKKKNIACRSDPSFKLRVKEGKTYLKRSDGLWKEITLKGRWRKPPKQVERSLRKK